MVWFLIVALLVSADQLLKALVTAEISPVAGKTVIESFFYLVNRSNTGGAWSIFADYDWGLIALSIVSFIASIVIAVVISRWRITPVRICLSVILAGSVGNLIDRVFYAGVTDYLSFHLWDYVFPTFNFADMLIVCGTISLILLLLIHPEWLAPVSERRHPVIPE